MKFHPKPADLAWVAGVFDGEGHVGFSRNVVYLDVSQASTHGQPQMLVRLQQITGLGRIYGPYGPYKNKSRKPIYRFEVSGHESVQAFVALMWNHLGDVKREQAKIALTEYIVNHKPRGSRPRASGECIRGHAFDGIKQKPNGKTQRTCSTCIKMHNDNRTRMREVA